MMKHLYVYTEEPSAKKVFDVVLRQVLPSDVTFKVIAHQGKQDLEKALKTTLPTLSRVPGAKILITMDQDNSDCKLLKSQLNDIVEENCQCDYLIRIICRELEAWFLGDLIAVKSAYPRFNPSLHLGKVTLRNVDKVASPDEYLLRIIPEYAKRDKLPKLEIQTPSCLAT